MSIDLVIAKTTENETKPIVIPYSYPAVLIIAERCWASAEAARKRTKTVVPSVVIRSGYNMLNTKLN